MVIVNDRILHRLDGLKSRIDSSKLRIFVRGMQERFARLVIQNAPHLDADNKARGNKVIKNFHEAWDYALQNRPEEFNIVHLQDVAGRAEPGLCSPGRQYAGIRQGKAFFKNINYMPPVDETRIRTGLERVLKAIEVSGFHPVEESVFLYAQLARIQPFENSNKRAANIIMNSGLLRQGYPPISIRSWDESAFKQYFEQSLYGFQEDGSKANNELDAFLSPGIAQRQFYDYMARKVCDNMSSIVDHLRGLPQCEIQIKSRCPSAVWSVKRKIDNWSRMDRSRVLDQKVDARKRRIQVVGEIPYKVLDGILKKSKGIASYDIIPGSKR